MRPEIAAPVMAGLGVWSSQVRLFAGSDLLIQKAIHCFLVRHHRTRASPRVGCRCGDEI